MKTPMLLLVVCLLLTSCAKQTSKHESDSRTEQQTAASSAPDWRKAEAKLKRLVDEFETKINKLRDRELRKQLAAEYAQKMLEFTDEFEGTAAAHEAWLYVMTLGSGPAKEKAMKLLLSKAESDLESTKAVKQLYEIVLHGEGDCKRTALSHLISQSKSPKEDVVTNSLLRLITTKTVPENMRTDALQRWVSNYSDHEMTMGIAGLLTIQQCKFTEHGLKTLARCTTGEINTVVVLELAEYINRRNSVREFYRDAAADRLDGVADELKRYLTASAPANETKDLVELIKAARSDYPEQLENLKRELFLLENLAIGKPALEIEGHDLDGVEFKLSDYRGQVVLLNFWGDW